MRKMRLKAELKKELERQVKENDLRNVEIYGNNEIGIPILTLTYDRGLTNIDWLSQKVLNANVCKIVYFTKYENTEFEEEVTMIAIDLEIKHTYNYD